MSDLARNRLRSGVFALLTLLTAASLLGTLLSPYLLVKSPLLLVAAAPATHHIVLAAATADPFWLVAVATFRRVLTGVGAYGLGYLYGRATLGWIDERYPRLARLVGLAERTFQRFGAGLLLLAPAPVIAVLAGSARARFGVFLLALSVGHALWNSLTYFVGDALARVTDLLTMFLGEHLLESTLACVLLVSLQQGISAYFRRRRAVVALGREGGA